MLLKLLKIELDRPQLGSAYMESGKKGVSILRPRLLRLMRPMALWLRAVAATTHGKRHSPSKKTSTSQASFLALYPKYSLFQHRTDFSCPFEPNQAVDSTLRAAPAAA
jgi:hypothetical protein